jgi:hypothetical protein
MLLDSMSESFALHVIQKNVFSGVSSGSGRGGGGLSICDESEVKKRADFLVGILFPIQKHPLVPFELESGVGLLTNFNRFITTIQLA